MTTLHALRRTYALSFTELSTLTGVPVRRLAEFEYHGHRLSTDEHRSVAAFFGVTEPALIGGFGSATTHEPTLTAKQAQAMALLAATALLTLSIRLQLSRSDNTRVVTTVALAASQLNSEQFGPRRTATIPPTSMPAPTTTIPPTSTPAPTTTIPPTSTPAPTTTPTLTSTPQPTATQKPTTTPRPRLAALRKAAPRVAAVPTGAPTLRIKASRSTSPDRCPVEPQRGRVIITQGYGIGTHAPAAQWGALDIAVAGGATEGAPVVATHAGRVQVTLNSWPGGNFVSISSNEGWRTSYAHLQTVRVRSGDYVEAGAVIGTVGQTGQVTGPHLHYETWRNGVNVDPSPVLNCT